MEAPLTDRRAVDAAVVSLQERLADGDPAAFSREAIEALREFSELLRETGPSALNTTSAGRGVTG